MRIIIQNVNRASCTIDNKIVGEISRGFCVFVGFTHDDTETRVERMVNKLVSLRLFDDENGKTNEKTKTAGDFSHDFIINCATSTVYILYYYSH